MKYIISLLLLLAVTSTAQAQTNPCAPPTSGASLAAMRCEAAVMRAEINDLMLTLTAQRVRAETAEAQAAALEARLRAVSEYWREYIKP